MIVTPEYNWSVPGVVKNMIDWASRPSGQSSWGKKPVAIAGATNGWQGTVRSQTQLKGIFQMINAYVMPSPEILGSHFQDKIDSQGEVVDQEMKQKIEAFVKSFADWINNFKT